MEIMVTNESNLENSGILYVRTFLMPTSRDPTDRYIHMLHSPCDKADQ